MHSLVLNIQDFLISPVITTLYYTNGKHVFGDNVDLATTVCIELTKIVYFCRTLDMLIKMKNRNSCMALHSIRTDLMLAIILLHVQLLL